jgi:hypothetical protein
MAGAPAPATARQEAVAAPPVISVDLEVAAAAATALAALAALAAAAAAAALAAPAVAAVNMM